MRHGDGALIWSTCLTEAPALLMCHSALKLAAHSHQSRQKCAMYPMMENTEDMCTSRHLKVEFGSLHRGSAPERHQDGVVIPGNQCLGVCAWLKDEAVLPQAKELQRLSNHVLLIVAFIPHLQPGRLFQIFFQAGCICLQSQRCTDQPCCQQQKPAFPWLCLEA